MSANKHVRGSDALLVKLRPSGRLRAAGSSVDLEPLYERPNGRARFGVTDGQAKTTPQWYLARLLEEEATPWDQAHSRLAAQLGMDQDDILFAEPDWVHSLYIDGSEGRAGVPSSFAAEGCVAQPQDSRHGKAVRPGEFAWHLGPNFSQLGRAREAVEFTERRTRIAHLDTGFFPLHETRPAHLRSDLQRNFVQRDDNPNSAADPDNQLLVLDSSGHGTGTLGILAGGSVSAHGDQVLGGTPQAAVVPIRIADSVVLLRTSALARALLYAAEVDCEVATLSMGGVPTRTWGEAVDWAYEDGLCLCAAAGNHKPLTPRALVYPARYDRVIAVCGVMADGRPYDGLKGGTLEGNYGPRAAMRSAMAAYTPNIPWPQFGCPDIVQLDGQGTSSATPQVAAAAALWIEKYKHQLPADWRRVEAVRHALFSSTKLKSNRKRFGNGVLQAHKALSVPPRLSLPKSRPSNSSFAFLRILTGLGIDRPTPREEMFNIELAQRWLLNRTLQKIVPDPEAADELPPAKLRAFMEAVIEDGDASLALRKHLVSRYPVAAGQPIPRRQRKSVNQLEPALPPIGVGTPEVPEPPYRRIRVFATDPSLSNQLDTAEMNEVTLKVRWEKVTKGPRGEYLKIKDDGPWRYRGVDLNDRRLLAQDGWTPSEGNPQFHQQMVYAVAMNTIQHFERALGRPVFWRPRQNPENAYDDKEFVRRLVVRPHALQQANAYYSPQEVALLFGYFKAKPNAIHQLPGTPVYTCLSHDIIAHETTHAVLDGMYRRFNESTNPDVLALHEAFADIVALLQHFTIPELLEHEIARTRGDLETESLLGKLAVQFGQTSKGRSALRQAIGTVKEDVWTRCEPDPNELAHKITPHARGAVLVGAVFDALIAIYKRRVADLLRIYTGGTGVLPSGSIHPDLVRRLADEAAKSASHVLKICIRALDYLPPVDVTFFDFLRALITADFEMVADDRLAYRVAFVEAFSQRGIFPGDHDEQAHFGPRALSADTLRWPEFNKFDLPGEKREVVLGKYHRIVERLREYADTCLYLTDREELFRKTWRHRAELQRRLKSAFRVAPELAQSLGLTPGSFEVHTLRRAMRFRLDGQAAPQIFVSLTQSKRIPEDESRGIPGHTIRGGSTLVVDLAHPDVPKYKIVKHIDCARRREAILRFRQSVAVDPLRQLFFSAERAEPFAALHELAEEGE